MFGKSKDKKDFAKLTKAVQKSQKKVAKGKQPSKRKVAKAEKTWSNLKKRNGYK